MTKKFVISIILGLLPFLVIAQSAMDTKAWSNAIDLDNDKIPDISFQPQEIYHGCENAWGPEKSTENIFYRKLNTSVEIKTTGKFVDRIISKSCEEIDYCVTNIYLGESQNYTYSNGAYFDKDSIIEFNGGNLGENIAFNSHLFYEIKFVEENTVLNTQSFQLTQNISKNIFPFYKAFNSDASIDEGFSLDANPIVKSDSIWYCKKFKSESDKIFYLGYKKQVFLSTPNPESYFLFGWVKFAFKEDNFSNTTTCDTSQIEILESFIGSKDQVVTVGQITTTNNPSNSELQSLVFPNPSTGTIELRIQVGGEINLVDLQGESVHRKKVETEAEILQLEDLPKGIYQLYVDGNSKPIKIVLQ